MSGVEIAGLVLGTVPVMLKLLESYRQGLEPFQRYARYRKDLNRLRKDIRLEVDKLLVTLESLLDNIVGPHQLRALLNEPRSQLWKEATIQDSIRYHLGIAYESFCNALSEFYEHIFELHDKLQQGLDGEVSRWTGSQHTLH